MYTHISEWSEVAQSCPTLCDPMDCSLPGSSVHGIFQAIVLEWIAISFSKYTHYKHIILIHSHIYIVASLLAQWVESACSARDASNMGLIPGLGRSPGMGNGIHSSILAVENSMDRGFWWAIVQGIAELDTTEHTHTIYTVYVADNSQDLKASGVVLIQRPGDLRPQRKLMFQLES